jgi:Rrf2 family transcriptional regulator, iron-sulfur cluster assembly transcription factor
MTTLYSRSTEYAIRALIRLARIPQGEYAMAREIASAEGIPMHFLAKILQELARKGWLRSLKGPSGGFMLRVPADRISLFDITQALEPACPDARCVAGMPSCSEESPCPLHEGWAELQGRIAQYLHENTVGDLVAAQEAKEAQARTAAAV